MRLACCARWWLWNQQRRGVQLGSTWFACCSSLRGMLCAAPNNQPRPANQSHSTTPPCRPRPRAPAALLRVRHGSLQGAGREGGADERGAGERARAGAGRQPWWRSQRAQRAQQPGRGWRAGGAAAAQAGWVGRAGGGVEGPVQGTFCWAVGAVGCDLPCSPSSISGRQQRFAPPPLLRCTQPFSQPPMSLANHQTRMSGATGAAAILSPALPPHCILPLTDSLFHWQSPIRPRRAARGRRQQAGAAAGVAAAAGSQQRAAVARAQHPVGGGWAAGVCALGWAGGAAVSLHHHIERSLAGFVVAGWVS